MHLNTFLLIAILVESNAEKVHTPQQTQNIEQTRALTSNTDNIAGSFSTTQIAKLVWASAIALTIPAAVFGVVFGAISKESKTIRDGITFSGGSTSSRNMNAVSDSSNNISCVDGDENTYCKGCTGGKANYACTDCCDGDSNKGCQNCVRSDGNIGCIGVKGGDGNIGCRDIRGGDNNIASVGLTRSDNNVLSESLVGCSNLELSSNCKFVIGKPGKKNSGIHLKGADSSYGGLGGTYIGNVVINSSVTFSSGGSARVLTSAEEEQYTASGHMRDQNAEEIEQVAKAKRDARDASDTKGTRESWEEFVAKIPTKSKLVWSAN